MKHYFRTWAQINLDAIRENIKIIRSYMKSGTKMLGVVKADAYGHGAVTVSKAIDDIVDMYAVSSIHEAIQLRKGGIEKDILILGYSPVECAVSLSDYHITQAVYSYDYAKELYDALKKVGKTLKIHIKVDTGMTRIGFDTQSDDALAFSEQSIIRVYEEFSDTLLFDGIFTHFAVSETSDAFTGIQYDRFTTLCRSVEERLHFVFPTKHCCNSAAIFNYPEMNLDMVRPGIILYGMMPDKNMPSRGLKPALELKTEIAQVKDLVPGMTVSYGRTFTAEKPMKTATIPIGYADGYSRHLSGKGEVLVKGRRAKIVGRICMDQCMIDVTDIPDVKRGTVVTLIGKDGDDFISCEEVADWMGTINYEVPCLIGKRVPRVYFRDNKVVDVHCTINEELY